MARCTFPRMLSLGAFAACGAIDEPASIQTEVGPPVVCDHAVTMPDRYYSWTYERTWQVEEISDGATLPFFVEMFFVAADHPAGDTDWWIHEYFVYDADGALVSHSLEKARNNFFPPGDSTPSRVASATKLDDYGPAWDAPKFDGQTFTLVLRASEQDRPECFGEVAFLNLRIDDLQDRFGFYAQSDLPAWLYPVIDPSPAEAAPKPGPGHDTAAAEDSGR
jgi:hypothetical protein